MPVLASTQQWGRDIKQALMKRALIAVLAFVVMGSALGQSPVKEKDHSVRYLEGFAG